MTKMNFTLLLLSCLLSANLFAQNVPAYVPTNGLVGWWPFNGNANDESGNGNNGIVNGATLTSDRFGVAGKAYNFDGVDDYISTVNDTSAYNLGITISLWVDIISANAANGPQFIVSKAWDQLNGHYKIGWSPNLIGGDINGLSGGGVATNQNIPFGQFVNVCFTYDNDSLKIYRNSILQNSVSYNQNLPTLLRPIIFGKHDNSTGYYTRGKLDDIGIWNRALSQQEVSALYNGNLCYQTITVTDTLLINTNITSYNPVTYENTIKIWPNPAKTHITIDAGDLNVMNGYSLRIVNAFGQQVFQSAINQQQFYLDLSTWTGAGIYYVNIVNPQGATIDIKKIVIQ